METTYLPQIATLRVVVGFLGERKQYNWWQSSFLGQESKVFLSPVFGRTHWLAQCAGVTQAAARVHDHRIGVGAVFHLFRLPETIEEKLYRTLQRHELPDLGALIASQEVALDYLSRYSGAPAAGLGPMRIGVVADLYAPAALVAIAAHYLYAFTNTKEVYPYFAGGIA